MSNNPFQALIEKWPSAFVARQQIHIFTGGLINSRYIANLDSEGKGPAGRVRVGRKVAYPAIELVRWLEDRQTKADPEVISRIKKK